MHAKVAHHPSGDCRIIVKAAGAKRAEKVIGSDTAVGGWVDIEVDLSDLAGKKVLLELVHQQNSRWYYVTAYWAKIVVESRERPSGPHPHPGATAGVSGSAPSETMTPEASPVPAKPNVLLITSATPSNGHDWRATTPVVVETLQKDWRLRVHVVEDPTFLGNSSIHQYDAVVLHAANSVVPLTEPQARESFRNYVKSGKGVVLIHSACAGRQDWPDFCQIVGRVFDPQMSKYDPQGPFRVTLTNPRHPITNGLQSFDTVDELYTSLAGDRNIKILASARSKVDGKDYPIAFVYHYGKGRVFQCLLGHDVKAMQVPGVGELYRRGCAWAAGLPPVETSSPGDLPDSEEHQDDSPRRKNAGTSMNKDWIVVFRSSDPAIWNTDVDDPKIGSAMSVGKVPDNIKYLRLRIDRFRFVIIPITKARLAVQSADGRFGWDGTNSLDPHAGVPGRHLGIYNTDWTRKHGAISVAILGAWQDRLGWGFGHRIEMDDRQGYSWAGMEIPKVVFEISVKEKELTKTETRYLLR